MSDVYVKNAGVGTITVKVVGEDGKNSFYQFPPYNKDKFTREVIHNGYTTISKDLSDKLLAKSDLYAKCVKNNILIITTQMPETAMSGEQLILSLRRKVAELEAASGSSEIVKLRAELVAANERIAELEAGGVAATNEVVEEESQIDSKKKVKK